VNITQGVALMAWYVKYENGIETERKKAGRGRPPAGFVREAEGNEDDPKQKMMYARHDEGGNIVERKKVGRGRAPKGFEKIFDDGVLMDEPIVSEPEVEPEVEPEIPAEILGDVNEAFDEPNFPETGDMGAFPEMGNPRPAARVLIANGDPPTMSEPDVDEEDQVRQAVSHIEANVELIPATKTTTFEHFRGCVDYCRFHDEDNNVFSMIACRMRHDIDIDHLVVGMTVSRIDVDRQGGDIRIWKTKPKGDPSIIIQGAIENE
tara:strand:+ start:10476 stop:11264 length:789 start_codon:yes stop_codon:yes gene_type:complete